MKKNRLMAMAAVIIALVIFGSIYVYANAPRTEIFTGIDGKKISVYTNQTFPEPQNAAAETSDVKPGDIIEFEGSQEIIIGISDDGRFITMPLEDYQLEQQGYE